MARAVDVAVVGQSLAAAAAVTRLAGSGLTTLWADDACDTGGIESLPVVCDELDGTPSVSGREYETRVIRSVEARVQLEPLVTSVDLGPAGLLLSNLLDQQIIARFVIAAPFGSECAAPAHLNVERFYSRGVSMDAASDASFCAGMPAVVLGGGYRAAEQALIAAEAASSVTIVSEAFDFLDLAPRVRRNSRIRVESAGVIDLRADVDGGLAEVVVSRPGWLGSDVLPARVLFLAQDLEFGAELYGGPAQFARMVERGRMLPAGLAAGVPHHDQRSAMRSGREVAEALLRGILGE